MIIIKNDRKYTKSHEWVLDNGDGTFNMGITDNAQEQLGDIVFVELPNIGDVINSGDGFGVIESVKAASNIYAPTDLEIISINSGLEDEPELINSDCYNDGYLITFSADSIEGLLDSKQYQELLDSE